MNNFTKSIVYSGVVLAAGLVAIFAIYNNMGIDANNVSYIEPAAGDETSLETVNEAIEAIPEALESGVETLQETAIEIYDTTEDALTPSPAENALEDAADDAAETEPASGDEIIENARELLNQN